MSTENHVEFRRCLNCGQVELVATGEVLRNSEHPRYQCQLPQEFWVTFRAPQDWMPSQGKTDLNRRILNTDGDQVSFGVSGSPHNLVR